jgi:hypothetical protein
MPVGTHSHKVRVANGIMVTNREVNPFTEVTSPDVVVGGDAQYKLMAPPDFRGGLAIYDVSTPGRPKHIANWETGGTGMSGVHRFDFDGRYAYISPTVDERVQSNDVTVDDRGLIYLYDRIRGLHILERV